MKKKILILGVKNLLKCSLVVFLMFIPFSLHSQQVEWLKKQYFSGNNFAHISTITDDEAIYGTGGYGTYGNPKGSFINKTDKNGNLIWLDTIPGDLALRQIHKGEDYLIVIGDCNYVGKRTFQIGSYTLTQPDTVYTCTIIAKYDLNGNVLKAIILNGLDTKEKETDFYNKHLYITGRGYHVNLGNNYYNEGYLFCWYDENLNFKNFVDLGKNADCSSIKVFDENNIYLKIYFNLEDTYIIKTSQAGTIDWSKRLDGTISSITLDENGYCYLYGSFLGGAYSFDGHVITNTSAIEHVQYYLAKLNSSGKFEWAVKPHNDSAKFFRPLIKDGIVWTSGIYCEKDNGQDTYLTPARTYYAKYTNSGNLEQVNEIFVFEKPNGILIEGIHSNGFYFRGFARESSGTYGYLGKISESTTGMGNEILNNQVNNLIIYPNPTRSIFNINYENSNIKGSLQLNVFSIHGQNAFKETVKEFQGRFNKQIDLSKFAKGTYFIELRCGEMVETKKIIVN